MISIKLEEFIDTRSLEKLAELYEVINQEKLSVKDTGVNYRVINHWDEKGIIRFARANKDSNRKFSFTDFVWIKIVNELRSFGVKLPVIQKIASEIYEPLPVADVLESLADNLDVLKDITAEDKEGFINFIKSGEYKDADFKSFASDLNFTYLHILIAEAIATRNSVSLIVFNDGEWFPFLKSNEHLYSQELLHKKEFVSQVRINITELIFKFILEDYLTEYLNGLHLFTKQEQKLLYYIKEGDYKKVFILFKSKKHEPIEITKSKTAPDELMKILREKEYREFILIDSKNNEFRIREGEEEIKAAIINDVLSPAAKAYHKGKRRRDALKKKNS
jgi:DNA-binding transcriptional MerR regulator